MTAHALLVSPLYVGIAALMIVVLALLVSRERGKQGMPLGDNGQTALLQAIRAHGNFAEFVPLALLVIVVLEAVGESRYLIHALGIALILGRVLHAWGLLSSPRESFGRIAGTTLTWAVLVIGGILLILKFFSDAALTG